MPSQRTHRSSFDKHAAPDMRLVTDANGEAHFDLPNRAPDHFYVHAELDGPVWDCTCLVRVVTEEVLRKGLQLVIAKKVFRPGNFRLSQSRAKSYFASNRHLGGSAFSGLCW
jgi:hypothetical protein